MADAAQHDTSDPYETACNEAIAACNGDLRSTIRALLIVNEFLEHELQEARAAGSQGSGWAAA